MSEATAYEKALDRIRVNLSALPSVPANYIPTAKEFVIDRLGGDPSQDGLYLCTKCGITLDPECDYGGWHSAEQQLEVTPAVLRAEAAEPAPADDLPDDPTTRRVLLREVQVWWDDLTLSQQLHAHRLLKETQTG